MGVGVPPGLIDVRWGVMSYKQRYAWARIEGWGVLMLSWLAHEAVVFRQVGENMVKKNPEELCWKEKTAVIVGPIFQLKTLASKQQHCLSK